MTEPEFDSYATDYGAGMDNPVKAILGDSADAFVAIKLRWLLRRFPMLDTIGPAYHILDYGCGAATLLRLMAERGMSATLMGSDVSARMLHEAGRHWPMRLTMPQLMCQSGARVILPDKSINLMIISAVLHHVPLAERPEVYAEAYRLLAPNGWLVVFEHNPLNPVTRYVVAHTPIDKNAILLRAKEVTTALWHTQFDEINTEYLMFLPPRLQALAPAENFIRWLPMGAQYVVTARR